MARLEYVDESSKRRIFDLTSKPVLIGRGPECDIVIADKRISRHHTRLHMSNQNWYLEDLGSTNGTLVNSVKIHTCQLNNENVIGIGPFVFHFLQEREIFAEPFCVIGEAELTMVMARPDTFDLAQEDTHSKVRLEHLLNIAEALNSLGSTRQMLKHFLGVVVKLLQPNLGLVEFRKERVLHASADITDNDHYSLGTDASQIIRRAAQNKEALIFNTPRVENGKRTQPKDSVIHSALCVPILAGGDAVGCIYADRRNALVAKFERDDLRFLIALSVLISAAMHGSESFARISAENRVLQSRKGSTDRIVGQSKWSNEIISVIENKVGPVDSTVLITGETGSGKTWIAESIHMASHRSTGPFICVNCASIPRNLIESELFGHEKGAFSGAVSKKIGLIEAASKGTLFLDEIGELDLASQAKILSVIQHRTMLPVGSIKPLKVDVRIVAATNKVLEDEVSEGRFRADLYYRLNVVTLEVPPLRNRPEDIAPLSLYLLRNACRAVGKKVKGIDRDAIAVLYRYSWPGNIRELSNAIERAVIFADDLESLHLSDFPSHIYASLDIETDNTSEEPVDSYSNYERAMIEAALDAAGGNRRKAAKILGWYPQKFYARLKKYKLMNRKHYSANSC